MLVNIANKINCCAQKFFMLNIKFIYEVIYGKEKERLYKSGLVASGKRKICLEMAKTWLASASWYEKEKWQINGCSNTLLPHKV